MKKSFSAKDRLKNIQTLKSSDKEDKSFDLLIIGGGITGAGVARDAASRGMEVALVEAQDFSFGTSSRSTKLIHGGLRYLENFEFGLVFEALSERAKLFKMAPHLVHPLRFLLPVYEASRVGMFKMGCGMWLYDLLARFQDGTHERLSPQETLKRNPYIKKEGLKGAYVYSDGYMDDDRLVFETLRSANDWGALSVNYVKAQKPLVENQKVTGVYCKEQLSGDEFLVRAKHVVSTVGPWTDEVGQHFSQNWKTTLKPSKGSHITLDKKKFPIKEAVVLSDDDNGRILFVVPRNDMVVLGTTDTAFSGPPEEAVATTEDVQYIDSMIQSYFPEAKIQMSDYMSSYSGVRPLVRADEDSVGKTSREHTIFTTDEQVTFVAGGKYTTYRKMAEEIVDESLKYIEGRFSASQTNIPLNEECTLRTMKKSLQSLQHWSKELDVPFEDLEWLWKRFGAETYEIAQKFANYKSFGASALWMVEAEHAIANTMCISLVDFFSRRTPLFLGTATQGIEFRDDILKVFSAKLSWSEEKQEIELQQLDAHLKKELSWK